MNPIGSFARWITALTLVSAIVLIPQAVTAQVTFGFEVNSLQSSTGTSIFHYDAVTEQLTVTPGATVDLTVGGTVFNDADFAFFATKDGSSVLSVIGADTYSATLFDGTFSFFEDGTGELILNVSFQDAALTARSRSRNGAVFQSDSEDPPGDLVQFAAGPALDGVAVIAPPEGFSFALGGASPAFNILENSQLNTFNANASFTAQTAVPEPGGLALALSGVLGCLCILRRFHRHA